MAFRLIGSIMIHLAVVKPLAAAMCSGCSSAGHLPNAWCQAVQCAPVYVNAGFCKCGGGSVTTEAPTTVAPTVAPTTAAPSTVVPTTVAPSTMAPTTLAPSTMAPTTVAPSTGSPPGNFNVVFRLDDVQDFFLSTQAQQIIDVFVQKQQKLSIGVIGGIHFGQDANIVAKVRDAVDNHNCEVFNHGDDASTLFDQISKEEAKKHILAAEEVGFVYSTFVPHQNRWSAALIEALQELGRYTVISAGENNMLVELDSTPKKLPQKAQTAVFSGGWVRDVQNVVRDCQRQFALEETVCVVMMHPQEFAEGAVSIRDLENLVDAVLGMGWSITTFQEFASGMSPTLPPATTSSPSTSHTIASTASPSTTQSPTQQPSTTQLPSTTQPKGSCTGCCGIAPWNTPNMDAWCQGNCPLGNCPVTHCSNGCPRRLGTPVWV